MVIWNSKLPTSTAAPPEVFLSPPGSPKAAGPQAEGSTGTGTAGGAASSSGGRAQRFDVLPRSDSKVRAFDFVGSDPVLYPHRGGGGAGAGARAAPANPDLAAGRLPRDELFAQLMREHVVGAYVAFTREAEGRGGEAARDSGGQGPPAGPSSRKNRSDDPVLLPGDRAPATTRSFFPEKQKRMQFLFVGAENDRMVPLPHSRLAAAFVRAHVVADAAQVRVVATPQGGHNPACGTDFFA